MNALTPVSCRSAERRRPPASSPACAWSRRRPTGARRETPGCRPGRRAETLRTAACPRQRLEPNDPRPCASRRARGLSSATMAPSTRNATRSQSSSAVTMSCVVRKTVAPASRTSRMSWRTRRAVDRIETGGRLVQEQQFGSMQQGRDRVSVGLACPSRTRQRACRRPRAVRHASGARPGTPSCRRTARRRAAGSRARVSFR